MGILIPFEPLTLNKLNKGLAVNYGEPFFTRYNKTVVKSI